MKSKKFVSAILVATTLCTVVTGFTGCSREQQPEKVRQISQAKETPEFNDGVAFVLGDYEIGIDLYMLYAIDAVPDFVAAFGKDCWTQESIDLTWVKETPQRAFILYLTDIVASSIACNVYYDETMGELEDSVKEMCTATATERYDAFMEEGMPEGVVTKDSLYAYTCSKYKLSYVVNELSKTYEADQLSMQAAILGMRNSIDETFDFETNINWELVETIDYSLATSFDDEDAGAKKDASNHSEDHKNE